MAVRWGTHPKISFRPKNQTLLIFTGHVQCWFFDKLQWHPDRRKNTNRLHDCDRKRTRLQALPCMDRQSKCIHADIFSNAKSATEEQFLLQLIKAAFRTTWIDLPVRSRGIPLPRTILLISESHTRVLRILGRAIEWRGKLEVICCENSSEFIEPAMQE